MTRRYSRIGRPRALSEPQIEELRAWAASYISFGEMCRRLNVSPTTARRVLRDEPGYKTPPPDRRVYVRRRPGATSEPEAMPVEKDARTGVPRFA